MPRKLELSLPIVFIWVGRHVKVCVVERVAVCSSTIQTLSWVLLHLLRSSPSVTWSFCKRLSRHSLKVTRHGHRCIPCHGAVGLCPWRQPWLYEGSKISTDHAQAEGECSAQSGFRRECQLPTAREVVALQLTQDRGDRAFNSGTS